MDFDIISGGLFLNERAGKVNHVAPHIKSGAYKLVEDRTGVKFGKLFLNDIFGDGANTLDSLMPSIALCIVKEKRPEQAMAFAHSLTRAVYEDGIDSSDIHAYTRYATKYGFKADEFNQMMLDQRYKSLAQQDFKVFKDSGVSAFPTLVIETEKGNSILAQGQSSFQEMDRKLTQYLE